MKKLLVSLCAVISLAVAGIAAEPIELSGVGLAASPGSMCLLPPRGVENTISWATNLALVSGNVLHAQNGLDYMVVRVISGVTTNSPTNATSYVAMDNIVYRPVGALRNMRKGFTISNISTSAVYGAFGRPAVVGQGFYLAPNTGSLTLWGPSVPQDAVYTVSGTTGAVVTAQEW